MLQMTIIMVLVTGLRSPHPPEYWLPLEEMSPGMDANSCRDGDAKAGRKASQGRGNKSWSLVQILVPAKSFSREISASSTY